MKLKKIFTLFLLFVFANFMIRFLLIANHRMVSGLNPYVGLIITLLGSLAITPFVIKGYRWFRKNWFINTKNEVPILFVFAVFCGFILWLFEENSTLDIHLHDTYFVFSNYWLLLFISSFYSLLAAFYYLFPKIFKRELNITFSRIHFWSTYLGLYLLDWMSYRVVQEAEPRMYTDMSGFKNFSRMQQINYYFLSFWILLILAQLFFVINIIYTLSGRRPDHNELLKK